MAINTIWEFPLKLTDRQKVQLPEDATIMSVGLDPSGCLCLWAAVDKAATARDFEIIIVGTGDSLPAVGSFLGTVTQGSFVWHVFAGPFDHKFEVEWSYVTRENG